MAYILKKHEESENFGHDDLMCSAHGCPMKWSVRVESKLCSYHAWEPTSKWPSITQQLRLTGPWNLTTPREPVVYDKNIDSKAWATRLKRLDDAGVHITNVVREMYKRALGIA